MNRIRLLVKMTISLIEQDNQGKTLHPLGTHGTLGNLQKSQAARSNHHTKTLEECLFLTW